MRIFRTEDFRETTRRFNRIPSVVIALFAVSVVSMNLLANKTVYQNEWLAVDGGILVSWLSFLCMDIVTKAFGHRVANRMTVFAIGVNLLTCLVFFVASVIPTAEDYTKFNEIFGGTWFILLSSTVAFLASGFLNNFLNDAVGRLFRKNPDGKAAFVVRSYVSTLIGQFFDNFVFALLTFAVFAPLFWNGFHWTVLQCFTCSVLGALLELAMEVLFSPLGYLVLRRWKKAGVGISGSPDVKGDVER